MIQKRVAVELRTVIERDDDREMSIMKQTGQYMTKNAVEIIKFTEEREDIGAIDYVLIITPDKVTIRRSGALKQVQVFAVGKRHVSLYRHPFGAFEMEIETKRLVHKPLTTSSQGEVFIQYTSLINNVARQDHLITFTYMEEKQT